MLCNGLLLLKSLTNGLFSCGLTLWHLRLRSYFYLNILESILTRYSKCCQLQFAVCHCRASCARALCIAGHNFTKTARHNTYTFYCYQVSKPKCFKSLLTPLHFTDIRDCSFNGVWQFTLRLTDGISSFFV